MKANQIAAIKKLEAAFLSCKRAGLTMCGIDDSLFVTVDGDEFEDEVRAMSGPEAMLNRANSGHQDTNTIKTYGVYRDSGAT
jgi:hypothetical protein